MMIRILALAAITLLAAAIPAGAQGKDPAYVGTWASQPAQCKVGQDMEDAPLIMKRKGFDQHETHCTFASVQKKGSAWTVKARCMVEGDVQRINMTLAVAGNRLTITDTGPRTLTRCP